MQPLLALLVLTACLVSAACRATSEPAASPEGTWRLVELEGVDLSVLARAPELVIGPEGALSGFAGVNRFSGKADHAMLDEGHFEAGPMIASRMAGPPEAMEAEQRFLKKRLEELSN